MWIVFVTALCVCLGFLSNRDFLLVSGEEAPRAPGLAASSWPIAHASTWNSDLSSLIGPDANSVSQFFLNGETVKDINDILKGADPITLVQSSEKGYLWGSSISSVFQIKSTEDGIEMINSFFRDYNFEYHGAYCLLAHDGTYYAATRNSIQAYNNEVPLDFSTSIVKTGEFVIEGLDDNEHLVGLTLTHDSPAENAFLVFATSFGQIGAVSLDFKKTSNIFRIPGIEKVSKPDHFVSNSIGMDGTMGGIYACTSYSLARMQWDPATLTISLSWNTAYGDGQDEWYWGRLGPGCGTSPTIMGPKDGKPEFVTINDGETPMNILFFDVNSGALVGKHVVAFGSKEESFNSTTDQSIAVKGYRAVVVNNWIADEVTSFCADWFSSLNVTEALKHECPYLFGAYVNGVEQFELNPTSGAVRSVWANSHVSCTSSIPVVSEVNNVLYCLGKRSVIKKRAVYTIEAMDWDTGKSLFHVELGPSLLVNSLYAATEVGPDSDIVMGTLAGMIRVGPTTGSATGSQISLLSPKATAANAATLAAWQKMDRLADIFLEGRKPTADELKTLGIKL